MSDAARAAAEAEAMELFRRFDYTTYGRLLERLAADRRNVRLRDLGEGPGPERFFILRHDVDLCPASALRMAEFEHARGFRATYFLLLGSRHYNLLACEHCGLPARLAELGHEVGLHYDVAALVPPGEEDEAARERVLRAQADLLALLAGTDVRSIAMHNPSVRGSDPFRTLGGYLNAYSDRFAREIAYASDSCGAWRDRTVATLTGDEPPARLQLLIHPFFWDERHADRWQRLRDFSERRSTAVAERETATRASWSAHAGVQEHDARPR